MVKGLDLKILVREGCNEEFVVTADAQEYMASRGKTENPRWCRSCHVKRKKAGRSSDVATVCPEAIPD